MSHRISTPHDFLFSSIVCFKSLFDNWGILINKFQAAEHSSLRRNAVCIWVNGLKEYWGKKDERFRCVKELRQKSYDLSEIEDVLRVFDNFTLSVLTLFTEDEQVAFWYARNSVLHGHLSLHFKDNMKILVFDSTTQKVKKVNKTRRDFETSINSIEGNPVERIRTLKEFKYLLQNYMFYLQYSALDRYSEVLYGTKVPSA